MSKTPANARVRRWPFLASLSIGFAAALFLTAWQVRLAAVFGTSALTTVTAIGGTLLGLAIGALIARRLPGGRPEFVAAVLHAAFAGLAFALPWILSGLVSAEVLLFGDRTGMPGLNWIQIATQSAIGLFVCTPPGVLIALMLMVSIDAGSRQPLDYDDATASRAIGLAALGAAAGVLAGAFAVAPLTGFAGLHWIAVASSAATAALLSRVAWQATGTGTTTAAHSPPLPTMVTASGRLQVSRPSRSQRVAKDRAATTAGRPGRWCLHGMALVAGGGALAAHCLWQRAGSHGAFADMQFSLVQLAAATAGIGLGALAGRRLVATRLGIGTSIAALNLFAAIATLLIYLQVLVWLAPVEPANWLPVVWLGIVALPFIVLGANFTFVTELSSAGANDTQASAALPLALVALGGAAGSAIAWLWVLPHGGFESLTRGVVATSVVVAMFAIPLIRIWSRIATTAVAAIVAVTTAMLSLGRPEVTTIDIDADILAVSRPIERYFAAGRTRSVRVIEYQGRFIVQIDGTPRASVPVAGSAPTQDARKWLATLPITARPDARSVLALGLGGGVMLEGIPASISRVDVIEAEPAVVMANRAMAAERVSDPLERAQITVIENEPRRALRLSAARYDIVVSQLDAGHDLAGATLRSRELFAQLRNHVTEEGIVACLLDSTSSSPLIVQSMAATLRAEFAHVRLYRPEPGVLIFMASAAPIEPELQVARSGAPITGEIMHYSRIGMNGVEDLLAALVADDAGVEALAQDATVVTDRSFRVAERDPQSTTDTFDAALAAADPLRQRSSWIYADLADDANFAYLTRRLIAQNQRARALAASEVQPDESMRLTMIGLLQAASGAPERALTAYERAVTERADNAEARYLLIESNIPSLALDTAPPAMQALADELPGSAAAVITARRAGAAQDWAAVADLDGTLGLASVTDAWYPDAVLVRAEWRSRVDQNAEQFAFDALRLIDRVVVIRRDRNFFLLRAAIGIGIGDGDIVVESSREIVRQIAERIQNAASGDGRIERRQVDIIRQNLEAITMNLRGQLVADDERRAEEVRQQASLILRFLDASLVERPQ